jgi:hypothetical protein
MTPKQRRPSAPREMLRAAADKRPPPRKSCFNAPKTCYFRPARGPGESYSDVILRLAADAA